MAYYRKSSPIPGYTGHIPGSKFHIDYFNKNLKNFEDFSENSKNKNNESRTPSLLNFPIDNNEIMEEDVVDKNEKEISQFVSKIPVYKRNSLRSSESRNTNISNQSNNSIKSLPDNYEITNNDKIDNISLLSFNSNSTKQNVHENNEIKRPNTVGKDRKEILKKKMEKMKPTGIWDKKPIPYEERPIIVDKSSPKEKRNPFEGAEKGWWSEGQALVNIKSMKNNQFYENSYNNNSKIISNINEKSI
uniref:Uncharacterized protein n=1 Tax=Strongyloides stercoralis TaxID=6248 RepID=A0A0K0EHC2_STRER